MKSRICLIRHGITEGNKRRLYYGYTDIPLAQEGIEELKLLVEKGIYPEGAGADFYTTGLVRTEQTLELIYGEQDHSVIEELREINFGQFEMQSYEELKHQEVYQKWIEDHSGEAPPPDGESIKQFYDRIVNGYKKLFCFHSQKELAMRHKDEAAFSIVVCHGGSISAIMENLYPGEQDNFYKWIPEPGHGYVLSFEDGVVTGREEF